MCEKISGAPQAVYEDVEASGDGGITNLRVVMPGYTRIILTNPHAGSRINPTL